MNVEMWHNPANLRNIKQLAQDGVHVLQPAAGEQACGETGVGRMQEPSDIAELLPDFGLINPCWEESCADRGRKLRSDRPVRGITNISSGQMGVALARACRQAGAQVDVIYANLQVPLPKGMAYTEQAQSAQAMYDAVFRRLDLGADVFIGVAAVADYRVKNRATQS